MDYVTYSPDGAITGGYSQELQPEHAGCYIEVTSAQREDWTSYRANVARTGVELIVVGAPPVMTLESVIAARRAESDRLAASIRDAVVAGTSAAEMASWAIKLAEAKKFAASEDPADAPCLVAEAGFREITVAALVDKVQANGVVLAGLEAQIAGINGKHRDALAAMTDVADVVAYDITAGYPELPFQY
jgi:hypothetical protein